jgi:16S rRNA (cytosine1402-N4)-methyltransferase
MSASDDSPRAEALHVPVLLGPVTEALEPRPGGRYLDLTLGMGGHAEAILEACGPDGRLLALDRDPAALALAGARLARFGDRVQLVAAAFSEVAAVIARLGLEPFDGVLADLGVSSLQLDDAARGFSFRFSAPLDMRMDPTRGPTAAELIEGLDHGALAGILARYGEVPKAGRVAAAILAARDESRLATTRDLARVVESATGGGRRARGRGAHPATQVFQALRIAVNGELEQLEALLQALPALVRPGGRVAIISFHSLEDRLVKHALRDPPPEPVPHGLPIEPERIRGPWEPRPRRAIEADEAERAANPRARSAKLRVAERREGEART